MQTLKMQRLTKKSPKQTKRISSYTLLLANPKKLAEFKKDAKKNRQLPMLQKYGLQSYQYNDLIRRLKITPPTVQYLDGKGTMYYLNNRPINWREFNFEIMLTVCRRAGL